MFKKIKNKKITIFIIFLLSISLIGGFIATYFLVNSETKIVTNENQQDTIYIDKDGKEITTSKRDLSSINSKEIVQIGFYKNEQGEIQVVRIPKTIEKVPDQLPSEITSLSSIFEGNSKFNGDISNWNTSNVVDISYMFIRAINFDQDLSKWDVSHVTNMQGMFEDARSFNQNISKWDVSHVTNMQGMFYYAISFNQDISSWNTSNVTNMKGMFTRAENFDQDLSKWNVEKVTEYYNFANYSGITDFNKLPKFKSAIIKKETEEKTNV